MNEKQLKSRAGRLMNRLNALGFTRNGKPMVIDQAYELVAAEEGFRNQHALRANLETEPKLALTPEQPEQCDGTDFVMDPAARGVWITLGELSVHVCRGSAPGQPTPDQGVRVYVHPTDDADLVLDKVSVPADVTVPAHPAATVSADEQSLEAAKIQLLRDLGFQLAYSDYKRLYWEIEHEASGDFETEALAWADAWRHAVTRSIALSRQVATTMQQAKRVAHWAKVRQFEQMRLRMAGRAHDFVRDCDHLLNHCCQRCGEVATDDQLAAKQVTPCPGHH